MYSAIITVVAAICAFNWLVRYVACAALLLYIQGKYDTLPFEEETKACLREAWLRVLHIRKGENVKKQTSPRWKGGPPDYLWWIVTITQIASIIVNLLLAIRMR